MLMMVRQLAWLVADVLKYEDAAARRGDLGGGLRGESRAGGSSRSTA